MLMKRRLLISSLPSPSARKSSTAVSRGVSGSVRLEPLGSPLVSRLSIAGETGVAPPQAARTAAESASMLSPLVTKPAQPAARASLRTLGSIAAVTRMTLAPGRIARSSAAAWVPWPSGRR